MLGPLASPWREVRAPIVPHGAAVATTVQGDRATFAFPVGKLVIDGQQVSFGRKRLQTFANVLGAKIRATGLSEGNQKTAIVLCVRESESGDSREGCEGHRVALLPLAESEWELYTLSEKSGVRLPLASQELVVHQINSHIESLRGAGTVKVESDTAVNDHGFPETMLDDKRELPEATAPPQPLLLNTKTASRPWQWTPVRPFAQSRLSFDTEGDELVVKCRASVPSVAHVCVMLLVVLYFVICTLLLATDPAYESCSPFPYIVNPTYILWLLLVVAFYLVARSWKQPVLRVSPKGWSIHLWPVGMPTLFKWLVRGCTFDEGCADTFASDAVLGAQVVARTYPSMPVTSHSSSVTAELHTTSGVVPLSPLLSSIVYAWDQSFLPSECETLVATINRHLEAVQGTPVAIQNDLRPSVFASLSRTANLETGMRVPLCEGPEHCSGDELLAQQAAAVRARNFQQGDRWVSAHHQSQYGMNPLHARVAHASVHPGGHSVQLLATHTTWYFHTVAILVISVAFGASFGYVSWISGLAEMRMSCEHVGIAAEYCISAPSCGTVWLLSIVVFLGLAGLYTCLFSRAMMRGVVRVDVDNGTWKVTRSPLRKPNACLVDCTRLGDLIVQRSRTVAEGTIDELRGCEVRVKRTKRGAWRGGPTHAASLVLHYHPAGAAAPKELLLAGCGRTELINLRERLIVAQGINSALAAADDRFVPSLDSGAHECDSEGSYALDCGSAETDSLL